MFWYNVHQINQFPASESVVLYKKLKKKIAFHGINGAFYLESIFYEVDEENVLKSVSIYEDNFT